MPNNVRIVSFADVKNASRKRAANSRASKEVSEKRNLHDEAVEDAPLTLTSERIRSQQRKQQQEREERAKARDRRNRERTKARADKMFDRQFAADSSAAEAEGAPRAALYKGKMGSSHRKSARMQQSASSSASAVSSGVAGALSSVSVTPRTLKIATAVVCVVLTCLFLYAPAQQYYQAQRERDRLAIEYSTIEQRNNALDVQNDALASDAGMEDAVRQKYGYVKSGEETAIVSGLSEDATDTSRDSEGIEANVLSSSVKAPEEWYTPILDAFFGVE